MVNEGLAFALRANDYHTSRQLLILYSLVAAKKRENSLSTPLLESDARDGSAKTAADANNDHGKDSATYEHKCLVTGKVLLYRIQ